MELVGETHFLENRRHVKNTKNIPNHFSSRTVFRKNRAHLLTENYIKPEWTRQKPTEVATGNTQSFVENSGRRK